MSNDTVASAYLTVGELVQSVPVHLVIESFLVLFILYVLGVKRSYNPLKRGYGHRNPDELTEAEIDELVNDWEPEPLVPSGDLGPRVAARDALVLERVDGLTAIVAGDDSPKLMASTNDFLGLAGNPAMKQAALTCIDKYALGSCGPRGFYGTTDQHLAVEEALARAMSADEAIAYSDAVSTVTSAIPAFSKRGDLLVVDDGVGAAVRTGCLLSRSKVVFFKHNDMADLAAALESVKTSDRSNDRSRTQRRFIVVEGVFGSTGEIAPLDQLVELKKQYRFRLMVDETLSFGTLGETGLGLTQHFLLPLSAIDVMVGSLATSLASVGGFCVGTRQVVDHQRLSGSGYCFSASAPPFTCAVATAALNHMTSTPALLDRLHTVSRRLHDGLGSTPGMVVISDPLSAVCHLRLTDSDSHTLDAQYVMLQAIVDATRDNGVIIARKVEALTDCKAAPTLRIHASAAMTDADVDTVVTAVVSAASATLQLTVPSAGTGAATGGSSPTSSTRRRRREA